MGVILLVYQSHFQIIQLRVPELLAQVVERVLELVLQMLRVRPAVLGSGCRHSDSISCRGRLEEGGERKLEREEDFPGPREVDVPFGCSCGPLRCS